MLNCLNIQVFKNFCLWGFSSFMVSGPNSIGTGLLNFAIITVLVAFVYRILEFHLLRETFLIIPPNHRTSKMWKTVVICFHFCFIVFHEAYTNKWLHAFEGIYLYIVCEYFFCVMAENRYQVCAVSKGKDTKNSPIFIFGTDADFSMIK